MESKPWYKSKTLWFNLAFLVLTLILVVARFFGYGDFEPGVEWQEIVAVVGSVINLILRYATKKPISRSL